MLFCTMTLSRLLNKGMSNIYLKIIIEKKWGTRNFDFLSLKVRLQVSFWGTPTDTDITEFTNFLLQLKNQRPGSKTVCGFSNFFFFFHFERNYYVLKRKSPWFLLSKNISFNKNETELKIKTPTHSFKETNFVLKLI